MKYVKYLWILLFTVFRKVFGLFWFWIAVHFRGWARNRVYNYKLQHGLWLKRLYERNPVDDGESYILTGGRTGTGLLFKKSVSWFEYQLAYWFVWIWVDDDSNRDVTDLGYIKTYLSGERKTWFSLNKLRKEAEYLEESCVFGNTFELGDIRNLLKVDIRKCWRSAFLWNKRNTAYNARYDMFETTNLDDVFRSNIGDKVIGWVPEDVVAGKQNYSLRFFEGED